MIFFKNSLAVLCLSMTVLFSQAQKQKTSATVNKGESALANLHYADAVSFFTYALQKADTEQEKADLVAKIADGYWQLRKYDSAYAWYKKLPHERLAANTIEKVRLAELSASLGKYDAASALLTSLSGYEKRAAGFKEVTKMLRDSADWTIQYAEGINTNVFREFSPIPVDGGLIWTTNQPGTVGQKGVMGWDNAGFAHLMKVDDIKKISTTIIPEQTPNEISAKRLAAHHTLADVDQLSNVVVPKSALEKLKQIHSIAKPIQFEEKVKYNIAHAAYDPAGKEVYLSINEQGRVNNQNRSLSLMRASLSGNVLINPAFMFDKQNAFSNMHPAIHPNGLVIVFSSNRTGGEGGFDLYITEKGSDSSWSEPKPLAGVNSNGNELFSSFSAAGKLYFSTDGHPGMGGLDIYSGDLEKGIVKNLSHISYPVNSSYDDFGMSFNADGTTGYFSSDRLGTDDIYLFAFEEKKIELAGSVVSKSTNKGRSNLSITLMERSDSGSSIPIQFAKTDANGAYAFVGKPNRQYEIVVENNIDTKITLDVTSESNGGTVKLNTISLADPEPLKEKLFEGRKFIVYFGYNKSEIRSEYVETLKEVAALLNANPQIICSLAGHTDQFGSSDYNQKLSEKRTAEVRKYLESLGVNTASLKDGSFGNTMLVEKFADKNKAEINRRVELELMLK